MWKTQSLRTASLAGLILLWSGNALLAQEAVSPGETSSRDSPVNRVDRGVTFPIELSTEVLGNLTGGTSREVIIESLLNVGVAIDLAKIARWRGATISIRAIYAEGEGLTNKAVHDFNTLSNIDAYDSIRLYDAWFQQEFYNGAFSLRVGQLLADAEFFNSDYASLFLNSSFGAIPLVSQNLNAPIFPIAAPGARVRVMPDDSFYFETALFNGDVGTAEGNNKHNLRISFNEADGVLLFVEAGYVLHPKPKDSAATPSNLLTGTYKLGGDFASKSFADSAGGRPHHGNYSLYFVVDQELWHAEHDPTGGLAGFARIGAAPQDRNTVTFYSDAGLNLRGISQFRPQDVLGLAFSYTQLSDKLISDSGRPLSSHHEAILELSYQAAFGSHLIVQPDLQFIFNPGAVTPAATTVVSGVRLNIQF